MNQTISKTLEIIFLIVFISIVPSLFFFDGATSFVWTAIIPLLPIGIVILEFSNWRNTCPLAFFSKISQKLNWFPKRKVPLWFENNFYYFQYFMLFSALSLRLSILNFDNLYLAIYFILIIVSAFATNLAFTGKSWCNFFCPVGVVEKIYCVSNAKHYAQNSACSTCTACKQNCPDIDMESNYWKEASNKQKSFVFYSFPGMVLGFYLYFYLQSGSFEYYFSGDWTSHGASIFSDGFFFIKNVPVFVAVPLTLAFFSLVSFAIFKGIERVLWQKRLIKNCDYETLQHRIKTITAFIAFNLFYLFAGAPTYSQYPYFYSLFYFFTIVVSTAILYKEMFRQESYFLQERFALKFVKKWDSLKAMPNNLKEIYYTYVNEASTKEERLKRYKETLKDLLQEGILNENSMVVLEKLREQIGVSPKDHLNVIKSIKLKNEELFDNSVEKSSEKRYQKESYKKMILDALNGHVELDINYIKSLQKQFEVTDKSHHEIMDEIFNADSKIRSEILELSDKLSEFIKLQNSIYDDKSREISFLKYSVGNGFNMVLQDLFSLLFVIYEDNRETLKTLANIFKGKIIDDSFQFNEAALSFMDKEISAKLLSIKEEFNLQLRKIRKNDNKSVIISLLKHQDVEIATAALLCARTNPSEYLGETNLDWFALSNNYDVNELLQKILYQTQELTTYEKMMYLNSIPLFHNIKSHDLKLLGKATKVKKFPPNEYVIKQGGVGDTLFIIIEGKARVEMNNKKRGLLTDKDYFGDIAIVGDIKRTVSVKTIESLTALTISKKDFKSYLDENPEIHNSLMKNIIKKLIELQTGQ